MGLVFEAMQRHPTRPVALKLLPRTAGSVTMERLRREGELLGRMRHPGIAEVYACGTYEIGGLRYPCLAMEYVVGARTILEYCDQTRASIPERLRIFAEVCDAVHYAHQRGVIHRDLKPANILVDSAGRPRVIDFGIARCLDTAQTSLQTSLGDFSGTLPYMSPEQVAGDPHDVDIRSDVYTLGVVLYRLITGQHPYEPAARSQPAWIDVIRRCDPPRPRALDRQLSGDIETLLLKALVKERAGRYQSAGELAADIRRYLGNEPLAARRPSLPYLLRKRFQQNPWRATALTLGAAATLALDVGGVVLREARLAITEKNRALEAERRAELRAYGQALHAADAAIDANDPAGASAALAAAPETLRGFEWDHLHGLRVDTSVGEAWQLAGVPEGLALDPSGSRLAAAQRTQSAIFDVAGDRLVPVLVTPTLEAVAPVFAACLLRSAIAVSQCNVYRRGRVGGRL